MSIATDTTYAVKYNGDTVDEIGQSKTLNNYTSAEIEDFLYCGCYNNTLKGNLFPFSTTEGSYDTWNANGDKYMPFKTNAVTGSYMEMLTGGGAYIDNNSNGRYVGVVLVVDTAGNGYVNCITQNNASNYRIVTEFDARNYYINHGGNFAQVDSFGATSWDDENAGLYNYDYTNESLHYIYKHDNTETDINLYGEISVFPYTVLIDTSTNLMYLVKMSSLILQTSFRANIAPNENGGYCLLKFTGNNDTENSLSVTYNCLNFGDSFSDTGTNTYSWTYSTTHEINKYHKTDKEFISKTHFQYHNFITSYWFTTLNALIWLFAAGGLKFKCNDKMYKPLISNNVVYGYTDDMTQNSEIDNYTGDTKHNIPVTPPAPPTPPHPTGDIETDMPLAYIGGTAGMVDFIKINAAGLASADDIADAISRFDITTIGKDLLRNFVAFKCYAVLDIDDSIVRDIKVSGHTLKDENDHALQGEYIGGVAPVDFSAGRVEPVFNDFRDYAPYTHIQMYVPFCGWFDLPSWCMGKEITGTMFTDLYNGTVKAVIYASRTVVAEVGGCCAFDIPFAAESTGMKAGAVISSALNTVAMTGATIAAPNIATGIAAVSSAANFISAANSNGTTMKGVMGDGSNTNGLLHVYIKVTRPNSPDGNREIPSRYKHENGVPCFKQLNLTAGDGYTQIMDANITGTMTDREKQMIIDGFKHGLIL